jgi:hypothetical protein
LMQSKTFKPLLLLKDCIATAHSIIPLVGGAG